MFFFIVLALDMTPFQVLDMGIPMTLINLSIYRSMPGLHVFVTGHANSY